MDGHGWQDSLRTVIELVEVPIDRWMIVGSAASALQGVAVVPRDIDVLTRDPEVVALFAQQLLNYAARSSPSDDLEIFLSTVERPTVTSEDGVWTFGRWWIDGRKVEVAHISEVVAPDDLLETAGVAVWQSCRAMCWADRSLNVARLEVQLATSISRRLHDRVAAIREQLEVIGVDPALLAEAMRSRGLTEPLRVER